MPRPPLTIVLLAALLLGAAGCSGDETTGSRATDSVEPRLEGAAASPSPPIVGLHVRLEAEAAARVGAAASALADQLGIRTVPAGRTAASPHGSFVSVDGREPPEATGLVIPNRYWGAFANFWSQAEQVSFPGLRRAAAGQVADWGDLGAPAGPLTVYLPIELRPGLERLLGPLPTGDAPTVHWLPLSEIADRVAADEGAIALLPVERAEPRLRSLAVDGVDVVRGVGEPGSSPLVERLWVRWEGQDGERLAKALAWVLAAHPPPAISVVATGDIIPARCVYDRQRTYGDYRHAFLATADDLRAADLTIGSLDAALSDAGEPIGCTPTFSLLAPSRSVEGLTYAGFDVVTVATNHAKDCGVSPCGDRAFLDTLAHLRSAGIAPVGGGESLADARRPAVLSVRGVRFAFLGYDEVASSFYGATEGSPGTAPLEHGVLAEDVAAALRQADVVVVMNHWGVEYTTVPTRRQVDMAREAVAAGATLIVGNHAHVVQAVEWLNGSFVAYGLGNFVFDQDWSLETQQGAVLEATFHGPRLVAVRFRPIRIHDQHQPRWADANEAGSIIARMRDASEALAESR